MTTNEILSPDPMMPIDPPSKTPECEYYMQTRTQFVSFSVTWLTPEGFSVAQRWL